jgi:hypothetical protein
MKDDRNSGKSDFRAAGLKAIPNARMKAVMREGLQEGKKARSPA